MLREAGLLQLDLLDRALGEQMILKDSTPYNVQWRGAAPVFVDIGSFERHRESEPWIGYRQFCTLFLFPLMFQAYRDVPFHPWLRGSLEGISPVEAAAVLSLRDRFRRGVPMHVALHARMERRHGSDSGREVKENLRQAGFKVEIVRANVRKMRKLVERLQWKLPDTGVDGLRRRPRVRRRGPQGQGALRRRGRRAAHARADVGPRHQRRRLRADRRAHVGLRGRDGRRPCDRRAALPCAARRGRPRGQGPAAGDRPLRPVARPRLAQRSSARRWRAGQAAAHPLPRPDPPPLDHPQRPGARGGGVAGRRSRRAWSSSSPRARTRWSSACSPPSATRAHADYDLAHFERCLEERFEVHNRLELPSGTRVLFEATARG